MKRSNRIKLLTAMMTALALQSVTAQAGPITHETRFNPRFEVGDERQMVAGLIIKYRKDSSALGKNGLVTVTSLSTARRNAGDDLVYLRRMSTGAHLMRLSNQINLVDAKMMAARIASDPNIEYVEPDQMLQHNFVPNDSRYNEQWHYFESAGGLRAPEAWDITKGLGAVVAVIDTGYRPHADLVANILPGYDFITTTKTANDGGGRDSDAQDPGDWVGWFECGFNAAANSSWHGTHVSGTIAAVSNNASGVAGVAYQAKVVPARVLGKCGGATSDIADAIIWSSGGTVAGVPANANKAHVISMSLGGSGACSATMQAAIDGAVSRGTVVIVAAGNSNANASNAMPANCNNVVTIAATNRAGAKASYSNFGAVVDVAAPGGETATVANGVLSTLNSGTKGPVADSYKHYQGTSMATPHVSGVAALMFAVKPTLTAATVESLLKSSARAFPGTCSQCGSGIVNAQAAVQAAQAQP